MPRYKPIASERIAGAVPAGDPAFWPQVEFPRGILDGDLLRYIAAEDLWDRESEEDFLADLQAYFDTIYGGSSYVHPDHSGDVISAGDGATTIANKQTLSAAAPLSLSSAPTVIAAAPPALSLVNDQGAAITEVDTGDLADSDERIPTSKAVKTAIGTGDGMIWAIVFGG